ncbi:ketose-bisphosphate aldolase [Nakamurella silvestris]|nr:ketose-bisphosphate aldolase [Nakamurella silvestris]
MPLVRTDEIVAAAVTDGVGAAAFNIITLEHAEAVVLAAESVELPVILQISQNAVRFRGSAGPLAAAGRALAAESSVPVSLHLDHVDDPDLLHRAADAGFSSVMFDAGALPYAENVTATRAAASWAHDHGLWIEAELGYVGGKPDSPASAHAPGVRTDPAEAAEFAGATGVDALAIAVGSSHAMTTRSAVLDQALIARIHEAVAIPLVLHGSSGVSGDQVREAIRAGITKVNVGTALNLAYTGEIRRALAADEKANDPRKYLAPVRSAVAVAVADLLRVIAGR